MRKQRAATDTVETSATRKRRAATREAAQDGSPPVGKWELPGTWCWAPVRDVGEVRLGRQRSPDRATGPNMRPYMRAANVKWTGIDLTDVKEMDFTREEVEVFGLHRGDVLVSEASGSRREVGKSRRLER